MPKLYSTDYICQSGGRFDVLKFVLAFLVVGIHAMPITFSLRPLFRVAVPLFFMMSSYFFFLKQSHIQSYKDRKDALWNYIMRIIKLYIFWTVLLLPYIIYSRKWYIGDLETVLKIIKSVFISGTFSASWFLTSSIISVSLIWFLSKSFNNRTLLWIGIVAYVICCLTSNYFSLYESFPSSVPIYKSFSYVFGKPCNSFLCAILFVVVGKILAENRCFVPNKGLSIILILSLLLLFVEEYVVSYFSLNLSNVDYSDDCFIMLIPLCICSFMLLGQNPIKVPLDCRLLRNSSTIIYCVHFTLISIMREFLSFSVGASLFVVASIVSFLLSIVLLTLEKTHRIGWLTYSH